MAGNEITFEHNGTKYLLERSMDYNDAGQIVPSRGWHVNVLRGRDVFSCGAWYETAEMAMAAVRAA